jgi:hypothetical protein
VDEKASALITAGSLIDFAMTKRSSKKKATRPSDPAQRARQIFKEAIGGSLTDDPADKNKNPAAVALGRLRGLKGGKARAAKLSARKRKEIAKKAAAARWSRKTGT